MKEIEFKKHQADQMRKINKLGVKAFRKKFKTQEEFSAYMRGLSEKGREKRMAGLKNYWKNRKRNEKS